MNFDCNNTNNAEQATALTGAICRNCGHDARLHKGNECSACGGKCSITGNAATDPFQKVCRCGHPQSYHDSERSYCSVMTCECNGFIHNPDWKPKEVKDHAPTAQALTPSFHKIDMDFNEGPVTSCAVTLFVINGKLSVSGRNLSQQDAAKVMLAAAQKLL